MCKSIDSSGDIPFVSTDLSFNMTQLPRYKLVLDSTYLEVKGAYFKIKYIVTCPQNILLVDLISQILLAYFHAFLNTLCSTHLCFPWGWSLIISNTIHTPWSTCVLKYIDDLMNGDVFALIKVDAVDIQYTLPSL